MEKVCKGKYLAAELQAVPKNSLLNGRHVIGKELARKCEYPAVFGRQRMRKNLAAMVWLPSVFLISS